MNSRGQGVSIFPRIKHIRYGGYFFACLRRPLSLHAFVAALSSTCDDECQDNRFYIHMIDSIHLRMAMDVDADAISRLIVSYSPVAPGTPGWEPFFHSISYAGILERLAQPEYCFVVAAQGEHVAGVIAMRACQHLTFFFVLQQCHGQGVGRKLWDKMHALALERGHPGPFFVNADPAAVPFYERLGFVVSGDTKLSLGIPCIPMTNGGGNALSSA